MNADEGCERVRELAPELAIGIADGQGRDSALRHAAVCQECRRLIFELASIADEVLLAVPAQEPPAGFAARTLDRMGHGRTRGRWKIFLAVAASFVLALAVGAGTVFLATGGDRRLADSYRTVLALGEGSFFSAAPVQGPEGTVGTAFGYQGQPSWIFLTLELPEQGEYRAEVVTLDGRSTPLGTVALGGAEGGWGAQIPVDLTDVVELRVVDAEGQEDLVAVFGVEDPWG